MVNNTNTYRMFVLTIHCLAFTLALQTLINSVANVSNSSNVVVLMVLIFITQPSPTQPQRPRENNNNNLSY